MQLAELDLNPSHPQAFYQSQKRTEEVSVKTAGLAQLSLGSRTRKGGSRCSSDGPPLSSWLTPRSHSSHPLMPQSGLGMQQNNWAPGPRARHWVTPAGWSVFG